MGPSSLQPLVVEDGSGALQWNGDAGSALPLAD